MLFNKNCCGPMPQFDRCCDGGMMAPQPMPQMGRGCCDMNQTREQCIVEPTINKCIEKEFYHEVPQV